MGAAPMACMPSGDKVLQPQRRRTRNGSTRDRFVLSGRPRLQWLLYSVSI